MSTPTIKENTYFVHILPIGDRPTGGSLEYSKYRVGSDTPPALRRQGIYQENGYSVTTRTLYDSGVRWEHIPPYSAYKAYGGAAAQQYAEMSVIPDIVYAEILPSLLENWRESKFNAGVSIAEGRESAELIGSTLLQLGRAARELKRGNLRGVLSNLSHVPKGMRNSARNRMEKRDLAGSWLELRYGWTPLLNDIYNLTEAVKLEGKDNVVRSSVKKEDLSYSWVNYYFRDEWDTLEANEKRLHMKVKVRHAPSFLERWGLTDPATIAWELVPYSFVVDWFLPIGDYLQSLHAIQAMPVYSCTESRVKFTRRHGFLPAGAQDGTYWIIDITGYYYQDKFEFSRVVSPALPTTLDVLKGLPGSINSVWDLPLRNVADAAALLRSRMNSNRFRI